MAASACAGADDDAGAGGAGAGGAGRRHRVRDGARHVRGRRGRRAYRRRRRHRHLRSDGDAGGRARPIARLQARELRAHGCRGSVAARRRLLRCRALRARVDVRARSAESRSRDDAPRHARVAVRVARVVWIIRIVRIVRMGRCFRSRRTRCRRRVGTAQELRLGRDLSDRRRAREIGSVSDVLRARDRRSARRCVSRGGSWSMSSRSGSRRASNGRRTTRRAARRSWADRWRWPTGASTSARGSACSANTSTRSRSFAVRASAAGRNGQNGLDVLNGPNGQRDGDAGSGSGSAWQRRQRCRPRLLGARRVRDRGRPQACLTAGPVTQSPSGDHLGRVTSPTADYFRRAYRSMTLPES